MDLKKGLLPLVAIIGVATLGVLGMAKGSKINFNKALRKLLDDGYLKKTQKYLSHMILVGGASGNNIGLKMEISSVVKSAHNVVVSGTIITTDAKRLDDFELSGSRVDEYVRKGEVIPIDIENGKRLRCSDKDFVS